MFLLYDLLILLATLLLLPIYLLRRWCGGKARRGLRERLGLYPAGRFAVLDGRPVIWVHAVSVGETRAAIPLLRGLRQAFPGHALLLSHVTETGRAVAESIAEVDACVYFPVDHSLVMRRVFARLQPQLVVIVETEIWPNLVRVAAQRRVPVALVNGRISDRSFPRYRALRFALRPILGRFSHLAMQSEEDARRIIDLGAPQALVSVAGNLKFDLPRSLVPAESQPILRQLFALRAEAPVWVAGSTHAGEEEVVLETYRRLRAAGHDLQLVLVPRHPERCGAVGELLDRQGLVWRRRSRLVDGGPLLAAGEVLLVDTLGEMLRLYAAGDLVFVGGSLVPVGGHNVLEACLVARPVLFGSYMHNFRDIAALVLAEGAGEQVADAESLRLAMERLLAAPQQAAAMGAAGATLLDRHAGATARCIAQARRLLG